MNVDITNNQLNKLNLPWKKTITVGRAYDLIREDVLDHLRYVQKTIGYQYIRFHALFHDDMGVVKRRKDGSLSFQWHHVDKIYDALLEMGLRPFVELNPMPKDMASGETTMFYYKMNVTPPRLYEEWGMLVEKFTEHCIERYGLEEVQQWYFEVWNEPNLKCFWWTDNQLEEYFKLYDAAAFAIKGIDPTLRVGGPATAYAGWVKEMIEHCVDQNVPIDFVSTHVYQLDEPIDHGSVEASPNEEGQFMIDTFKNVEKIVKDSALPDLEIHWTEWNAQTATTKADVTFMDNEAMDNLYGGSLVAFNCIELDQTCDSMAYWAASDIFEEHLISNAPFACSYGIVTQVGIPKATANAFRLMSKLRGKKLELEFETAPPHGCGVVATKELKTMHGFVYNHLFITKAAREAFSVDLNACVDTAGKYLLTVAKVKVGAGSAKETWVAMGRPQNLTPIQEEALRNLAEPEYSFEVIDADDSARFSLSLESNEFLYFELKPVDEVALAKSVEMNLAKQNQQLFTDNALK
jgi:xylan 1,4-beta-xylosidase